MVLILWIKTRYKLCRHDAFIDVSSCMLASEEATSGCLMDMVAMEAYEKSKFEKQILELNQQLYDKHQHTLELKRQIQTLNETIHEFEMKTKEIKQERDSFRKHALCSTKQLRQ